MGGVHKVKGRIHGVGINDADYPVNTLGADGKRQWCPAYRLWQQMINRCYSGEYKAYQDCTVSEEWHSFTEFRHWLEKQEWQGLCLDKDIFLPGNKTYSPCFCVLVSQEVNNLLCSAGAIRGNYPQGVSLCSSTGRYRASINIEGKSLNLGRYETPEIASTVYRLKKAQVFRDVASRQASEKVAVGLRRWAQLIECTDIEYWNLPRGIYGN